MPAIEFVFSLRTRWIYQQQQIEALQRDFGDLPICFAKAQYSFSTDPNSKGAPVDHETPIKEVRLSAGAGFIVVVAGAIMTMSVLPSKPAANSILLISRE
nr:formate--tetrahydrofolate ligase [Rhodospirillales bacterium]